MDIIVEVVCNGCSVIKTKDGEYLFNVNWLTGWVYTAEDEYPIF